MHISLTDAISASESVVQALTRGERLELSREVEAELGKRSTYYLAKYIIGYDKLNDKFHVALCRFIDNHLYEPMLILAPRGHYKTTCKTITGITRMILCDPDISTCIMFNTMDNATIALEKIRNNFVRNDKFRALYPEHATKTKREEGRFDSFITPARKKLWKPGGTVDIAGADRAVVSRHYDFVQFDDLVDNKNVTTADQRKKVYSNYSASLSVIDRETSSGYPWHHIVGTRWSFDDMYSNLLEENRAVKDQGLPGFNTFITKAYFKTSTGETEFLFPEEFTQRRLDILRAKQGDYLFSCTPGWAPVWMADGTFKPIEAVNAGDEVVGFEIGTPKDRTKLVKTKVKETNHRFAQIQEVTLDNGDIVHCTPDHQWYTGRTGNTPDTHRSYAPVVANRRMMRTIKVPGVETESQQDWGWLGGMMDGEGGLTHSIITISQSYKYNRPVINKLRNVLNRLNIEFSEFKKVENSCICFNLRGGKDMKVRILANARFAKSPQLVKQLFLRGKRVAQEKPKVVNIRLISSPVTVYALVTETGNYISQGYASKNCLYLNDPSPEDRRSLDPVDIRYYDPKTPMTGYQDRCITVDPATSLERDRGDPSVIGVYSMDADANLRCLDLLRGWWDPDELISRIIDMHKKYKINKVGFESVNFSSWGCHYLEKERKRQGLPLRVIPIKRGAGEKKKVRLDRIIPYHRTHKILWRRDDPELDMIVREHREHPTGRYDDILDTLCDAIEMLVPPAIAADLTEHYTNPPITLNRGRGFRTGYNYG